MLATLGGLACVLVLGGVTGWIAGLVLGAWAWRALGRVETPAQARRRVAYAEELPYAIDLLAGVLAAGGAPSLAIEVVGDAVGGPVGSDLDEIARRLGLGADPATVWADVTRGGPLAPLGRALLRAHDTGGSVRTAVERLAEDLRIRSAAREEHRAHAVSTRAAAPLGLCFLPAFVLLGVVPLVGGLLEGFRIF